MASASSQLRSASMASTSSQVPVSMPSSTWASTYAPTSSVSYLEPPSSSETPSSSTSPPPDLPWDVFLSFRGKDTRHNFTSHLYSALHRNRVRTFMDDPALRTGDLISDALIKAIKDSKTYIVIFSENYASSRWCLDELVEIYDCYKNMKRLIVGVYHNIEPSVVRHQTGSFRKAFKKHESRAKTAWFNKAFEKHRTRSAAKLAKVGIWRETLKKVADFSGKAGSAHRSEADLVTDIVNRILVEINPTSLRVARYPVGLDSRIKDVTTLLRSSTEGVTKIGIYGMGGVGKTTLAIAVYNQNYQDFEGSCFLENVREASVTKEGKVRLQRQLINNVLKRNDIIVDNVEHGVQLITKVCTKKVLIVIDNLDDPDLLQFLEGPFATGSKIIITTRNEDLLDSMEVEPRYKVNELGDAESRQLFNKHAALRDNISDKLMEFSQEILKHAGGLPLALTVFGDKMINQKRDETWIWFIDVLGRGFDNAVEDSLLISFNALNLKDPMMQNIFLDIACFFVGRKEKEVVKIMETYYNFEVVNIMETYYNFVDHTIGILMKRSLLTINDRHKLGMHHQLSHMGRRIVRKNFPEEPEKHSRLWESEDICEVLKEQKGTGATSGIIPFNLHCQSTLERVSFVAEAFVPLSKLKFLYLNNVDLTGSFKGTFKDLRWLCWESCPLKCLPSEFHPQKLVMLEFPNSKLKTMWEVSQDFEELKILNMSDSQDLTTTPEFTKLKCLTTLDFEGCKSLKKVHTSIGSLNRLISLNLHGCMELTSLEDTICDLKALKVLNIGYCQNLRALPPQLGNIKSLEKLDAEGLTISSLPDSIGRLSKLVVLSLKYNQNLETLPNTICNLRSLEHLDISRCKKMVKVTKLMELDGSGSGAITNDLTHVKPSLPSGITRCSNPENHDIKDCIHLYSSAELPPNLKRIKADGCTSMERLPCLSNMKQLKILDLRDCNGLMDIQDLKELTSITGLHLTGCNSPFLACTLTKHLFQIYSGFGHPINIYTAEFPSWISQSVPPAVSPVNNAIDEQCLESTLSLDLLPNVSQNFLGIILCFKSSQTDLITYSVRNTTSDVTWSAKSDNTYLNSLMVMVPRSIFSVRDGDTKIELTADTEIYGIHLLCKMIEDSNGTIVKEAIFLNGH